jgi:hypothetical protein
MQYETAFIIKINYYGACSLNVLNSVTSKCCSVMGLGTKFDTKMAEGKTGWRKVYNGTLYDLW